MPALTLSSAQRATAAECYRAFRGFGWKHAHACGLLAMAVGESSLNPQIVGDHGHSFGLWQIQDVASVKKGCGIDIRTASATDQCKAVDWMLAHTERRAGEALEATTTPSAATVVLVDLFERPGNKPAAIAKRTPYAEAFDAMFKDTQP